MASSIAFFSGTLRCRRGESAPSAMTHLALGSMPLSSSNVERRTPVHSEQEASPCSACTFSCSGSLENNGALLPPHSTKPMRAAMADREVQAVRRDDALEQMMRRAGARVARQIVRIVDRAHHVLLEP